MNEIQLEASFRNRAIRAKSAILVKGMTADRDSIALQCYARELIPQDLVKADTLTILHTIQDRVVTDATGLAFETFCDILQGEPTTAHLAENLQKRLKELRKEDKKSTETSNNLAERVRRSMPTKPQYYGGSSSEDFKTEEGFPYHRRHLKNLKTYKNRIDKEKLYKVKGHLNESENSKGTANPGMKGDDKTFSSSESDNYEDESVGSEESQEETLNLGNMNSVNQQEFLNYMKSLYGEKWQPQIVAENPHKKISHTLTSETNKLEKQLKALTLITPEEIKEKYCCGHLQEILQLREEKETLQIACEERIRRERNRLYLKLKLTKWERRERTWKLKHKLYHLHACLKESLSREEELSREVCYMDMYYTGLQAQNSHLLHKLKLEQERVTHVQEKRACLKKKYSGMEGRLAMALEECQKHKIAKESLEEKLKELQMAVDEPKKQSLQELEESPQSSLDEQKSLDSIISRTL